MQVMRAFLLSVMCCLSVSPAAAEVDPKPGGKIIESSHLTANLAAPEITGTVYTISGDNVVFDGGWMTIDAPRAATIFAVTGRNVVIKHVTVRCAMPGAQCVPVRLLATENVRVEGVVATDMYCGVILDGDVSNLVIRDCDFRCDARYQLPGVVVKGHHAEGLTVSRCILSGRGSGVQAHASAVRIEDCVLDNCGTAVQITDGAGISIVRNRATSFRAGGISVTGATDVTIEGNTLTGGSGGYAIALTDCAATGTRPNRVCDNVLGMPGATVGPGSRAGGVSLSRSLRTLTLAGNCYDGCSTAVYVTDQKAVLSQLDLRGASGLAVGLELGPCDDVTVVDARIPVATRGVWVTDSGTTATLVGCQIGDLFADPTSGLFGVSVHPNAAGSHITVRKGWIAGYDAGIELYGRGVVEQTDIRRCNIGVRVRGTRGADVRGVTIADGVSEGVEIVTNAPCTVQNCTVRARESGIYLKAGVARAINSVLWGSSGSVGVRKESGATATTSFCIVQPDSVEPQLDDSLRPTVGSPCIGKGNYQDAYPPRAQDIGAVQVSPPKPDPAGRSPGARPEPVPGPRAAHQRTGPIPTRR